MQNKEAIAALQEEIEGLRQDLALGVITKSEFGVERGKRLAQIDTLDTRRSCTFSPEPTPEETRLVVLKNRVTNTLDPFQWKIGSAKYNAMLIAVKHATDANQVEVIYNDFRDKLRHKNIADLPDLHAKPKPVRTRYDKAA